MKNSILIIFIIIVSSCSQNYNQDIDKILASTFDVRQISAGSNFPKVDIKQDCMYLFLVALHYKIPIEELLESLNWNEIEAKKNINLLTENQLLEYKNETYMPKLCIFTLDRGRLLSEKCQKLANEISDSIKTKLEAVKKLHNKTDISKTHSFYDLSFFYLSDILLDNGQISNVEQEFLGKERPARNGRNYYLAILEKPEESIIEPYGIYGNQILVDNDTTSIAVYGNTRTELNKGWREYKNKSIHIFSKKDYDIINEMPKIFLSCFVKILNSNKGYFERVYTELNFDKETSFEEFFIWWYHIIYTEATDILIKQNIIKSPENGLFYYVVKK